MTSLRRTAKEILIKTSLAITSPLIAFQCRRRPSSDRYGSTHIPASEHLYLSPNYLVKQTFPTSQSGGIVSPSGFQPFDIFIIRNKDIFSRAKHMIVNFCNKPVKPRHIRLLTVCYSSKINLCHAFGMIDS